MKALLIGGTGTISTAVTELAAKSGIDLTLLNRGRTSVEIPENVRVIRGDIENEEATARALEGETFDVVAQFIGFTPEQAMRDIRLFAGKTKQYIYISSAAAYQKPPSNYLISESTPLANPYWKYGQNKIASEAVLMEAYRNTGFPVTIVRPSHTYGKTRIPVAVLGSRGSWQVIARILQGKPVIVHIATDFLAAAGPKYRSTLLGDKANSLVFDNSKLKRLVPGFSASVRFDQGVGEAIRCVMDHPEYQIPDPEFDSWCDRVIAVYRRAMEECRSFADGI